MVIQNCRISDLSKIVNFSMMCAFSRVLLVKSEKTVSFCPCVCLGFTILPFFRTNFNEILQEGVLCKSYIVNKL